MVSERKETKKQRKKQAAHLLRRFIMSSSYYARSILPERKHRVHTVTVFTVPFSIMRIFLRFGLQTRFVWILEWLTEFPEMVPFLHT
jgi:hypothetical protein